MKSGLSRASPGRGGARAIGAVVGVKSVALFDAHVPLQYFSISLG